MNLWADLKKWTLIDFLLNTESRVFELSRLKMGKENDVRKRMVTAKKYIPECYVFLYQ